MKLVSWNVNGLRAVAKKGFAEWLTKSGADIVALQETKAAPEQLPENIRTIDGYESYFHIPAEKKGYSGVAVYTKIKPEKVVNDIGVPELDREGRLIALYYPKFVFLNCYFPNGKRSPERLQHKMDYYDAFLKFIEKERKKGRSVIFCGDVNTAHEEIDLARPKENSKISGFLPEERAWMDELIARGYIDTFRHFYPDKKDAYSWWDQFTHARERNVGWRIDYFFVSSDLVPKLKKAFIESETYGSDHCPVGIEINI